MADDLVLLDVPADGEYLAVLRTATAGLAARLQFTLDDIEDLRIAVDEACAMLLDIAAPFADLSCRFEIAGECLVIEVSAPTVADARLPGDQSFAWQVLTALAGEVATRTEPATDGGPSRATIRMAKRRPDSPDTAG